MKLFILVMICLSVAHAQPLSKPLPTEDSVVVPVKVKPTNSPIVEVINDASPMDVPVETKSRGTVFGGYQLITTWIPSKWSLGYSHIFNKKWSLEGEYSRGSISDPIIGIDLGKITEERVYIQGRRYLGNSFNLSFGGVWSDLHAKVGHDILGRFGEDIDASFRAQNLGITFGMGNRWQWERGFTLGIDWFRVNIPIRTLRVDDDVLDDITKSDRDDVKKVIRTFNRLPTFVLFGLQIGYTF